MATSRTARTTATARAAGTTEVSVRDTRPGDRPGGLRAVVEEPRIDPLELRRPGGRPTHAAGVAPRGPVSRPDPTAARLAAGMVGAAATRAIISAIVGGASSANAAVTTTTAVASGRAQAPVRHITQYVTIPSNATPPPRKVVYATPVPAPQQQRVVVVTTTQSGRAVP